VFFGNWASIGRIVMVGILAFIAVVLVLRLSGKRTLAKMNAFDLVVTVALGSTLATILLTQQVALAEGLTALAMLIGLQFLVAWLAVRSARVRRTVKSVPTLLLSQGHLIRAALVHTRVTEDEVRQAIRSQGQGDVQNVAAVVLETDGSFSVITRSNAGSRSALSDVD
jgi:uncharacterized membrane protein YcaP (DUF421 family)